MMLPEAQLKVFIFAGERKRQAEHRTGVALMEFRKYERLAQEDWNKHHKEQDAAVQAGLRALGLPIDDPKRHFHVNAVGMVLELVNGEYVEPKP